MKQSTITLTHDNGEETRTFSVKYWSNYGILGLSHSEMNETN